MSTRLDHVMIAVAGLDAERTRFDRAGLHFGDGGRHPFGTANALAVHPHRHAYLELITVADPDATGALADAVRVGGLVGYALTVDDIDAAVTALAGVGVECSAVSDGERVGADGDVVRWRTATLHDGFAQSELPFLIWWPERPRHRTAVPADERAPTLRAVRIGTTDPSGVGSVFDALGLPCERSASGLTYSDGEVVIDITAVSTAATGVDGGLMAVSLARPDGTVVTVEAGRPDHNFRIGMQSS